MVSGTGDDYPSETSRLGCFTDDLGKFVPEFKLN